MAPTLTTPLGNPNAPLAPYTPSGPEYLHSLPASNTTLTPLHPQIPS